MQHKKIWIIISDLDEIPNLEKLHHFKKEMRYAVFKQNHYYYKLKLHRLKKTHTGMEAEAVHKKILEITAMVKKS